MTETFALLPRVRKDDSFEQLIFASPKDAEHFIAFVAAYQHSGPGNGYNAYWLFDKELIETTSIPSAAKNVLEYERIESMARDITRSRGSDPAIEFHPPTVGRTRGALCFAWDG